MSLFRHFTNLVCRLADVSNELAADVPSVDDVSVTVIACGQEV